MQITENSPGHLTPLAAGKAQAFVPGPPLDSIAWNDRLVSALSAADQSVALLGGIGRRLASPHLISGAFGRKEAVLSSRIEGTQSSLAELFLFEAAPENTTATQDVREVYNYVQALRFGVERLKELPVSSRLIREMHKVLMSGVRGQHRAPGEYRRSQNWIGPQGSTIETATYVPPPPQEMQRAMGLLESYINRKMTLPLLAKLAVIHYQFEAIHPFLDGNGRIGRILIPLVLCAENLLTEPLLYLSAYFESNRKDYYQKLLAVSLEGAWIDWVLFFLIGVKQQADDARERCERLLDLHEEYQKLIGDLKAPASFIEVVDRLFVSPYICINQVKEVAEVTYPTAKKYLLKLRDRGVVIEGPFTARGQLFVAEKVLAAIDN